MTEHTNDKLRIQWWAKALKKCNHTVETKERLKPFVSLQPEYKKLLHDQSTPIDILDVYSGPLTHVGNCFPHRKITITQLEPEAVLFESLLNELDIRSRGRLVAGGPLDLPHLWSQEVFDLIIIKQAGLLTAPLPELPLLYDALRPGGALILTISFGIHQNTSKWRLTLSSQGFHLGHKQREVLFASLFPKEATIDWRLNSDNVKDNSIWATIEVKKPECKTHFFIRQLDDFKSTSQLFSDVYGTSLTTEDYSFIASFFERKPSGTVGSILPNDAAFILVWLKIIQPTRILEIGVSSGVSSAFILEAAEYLNLLSDSFCLNSLDILPYVYATPSEEVGWVVQTMSARLYDNFNLITGESALQCANLQKSGKIETPELVFLDAEHAHPFPQNDLDSLSKWLPEGTWILIHDICLFERSLRDSAKMIRQPEWFLRGVEWAFEFWPGEKIRGIGEHANMGAVKSTKRLSQSPLWKTLEQFPAEPPLTPNLSTMGEKN